MSLAAFKSQPRKTRKADDHSHEVTEMRLAKSVRRSSSYEFDR